MNDFLLTKPLLFAHDFLDKTPVSVAPQHRFFALSQALMQHRSQDILFLFDDNDLLDKAMRAKLHQDYQRLLVAKPQPHACVLLAITDEDTPRILLTRRASTLSSHAGEVSLVGGKRDVGDGSSYQVALREAFEEVGLLADDSTLLGFLPMQISQKGLLVRPVVASITSQMASRLVASQDEICRLFWADLPQLIGTPPSDYVFYRKALTKQKLHTPAWLINDGRTDNNHDGQAEVVWGLTGKILANFLHIGYGVSYPWYYRLRA
ncbi:NUDIX hydrolase [Moraxella sp. ZJ142]|uniref:NUDIX hydrolase n=1 Tax=Moraxella marmotae TaxID=3344520 RepID=UPI0035D4C07F